MASAQATCFCYKHGPINCELRNSACWDARGTKEGKIMSHRIELSRRRAQEPKSKAIPGLETIGEMARA